MIQGPAQDLRKDSVLVAWVDRSYQAKAGGSGFLFAVSAICRYNSGSWEVLSGFILQADEVSLARKSSAYDPLDGQHAQIYPSCY